MILSCVLGRVFCLCPVLLGCDNLCCLNVVLLGCWESLGGLMGTRVERNEDMGYVGVRELSWRWATGDGGLYVICGCGELFCTIARPPPSTTCDGYP